MELREFITQVLCDIAGGVHDAQKKVEGAEIVPFGTGNLKTIESGMSDSQSVEFEVAVSTTKKSGSEAKLSVVAGLIGGGVHGNSDASHAHAATLRFRVPIRFNRKIVPTET